MVARMVDINISKPQTKTVDKKKLQVGVYRTTAYCTELLLSVTADNQENAVRELVKKIRVCSDAPIELPYLGAGFDVEWHSIPKPKPKVVDDFEEAQKLIHQLDTDMTEQD